MFVINVSSISENVHDPFIDLVLSFYEREDTKILSINRYSRNSTSISVTKISSKVRVKIGSIYSTGDIRRNLHVENIGERFFLRWKFKKKAIRSVEERLFDVTHDRVPAF